MACGVLVPGCCRVCKVQYVCVFACCRWCGYLCSLPLCSLEWIWAYWLVTYVYLPVADGVDICVPCHCAPWSGSGPTGWCHLLFDYRADSDNTVSTTSRLSVCVCSHVYTLPNCSCVCVQICIVCCASAHGTYIRMYVRTYSTNIGFKICLCAQLRCALPQQAPGVHARPSAS